MAHNRVGGRVAGGVVLALVVALLSPARTVAAAPDLCAGLVELRSASGQVSCSYRPDAPPAGVDIKSPRPPVPANRAEGVSQGGVAPICTGDGTSGPRVQLVYARPTGAPDRFDAYAASFRAWAAQVDAGVKESAEQTGGSRRIRFVHDASCTPTITRVVVTTAAISDGGAFNPQIRAAHGDPVDRRFLVWMDATEVCGVAEGRVDDRADGKNRNNGPESLVARVDSGCWGIAGGLAEGHELFHSLGAVQRSAPHATPGFHCTDDFDRMCGVDGSGLPVTVACPANHDDMFDCNHDDYFHTDPAPGSYLATHWNTADSRFLTAPPAAMSDVGAVATEGSATVGWSAAHPEITGFQVRAIVDGVAGPPVDVPAGATSYTPAALPGGAPVRFIVAARNEYGVGRWSAPTAAVVPSDGSRFHPLPPGRLLDTRSGNGAPASPVMNGATVDLQVTGRGGVPAAGVAAVVLNVTVTEPWAGGHLTAWPTGEAKPLASNLNVEAGRTVANLVTVKVGAGGKVSLYNGAGVNHLIADVAGWYGQTGAPDGSLFHAVAPTRLLDTRSGNGAPAGWAMTAAPVELQVAGRGGVPATGASGVVLNVTVTEPVAGGFLTAWPAGEARPLASNLNFTPGQTVPNLVVVKLGAGGKVSLYHSGTAAHLVADVAGWFGDSAGARYHPVAPARLLDTRTTSLFFPPELVPPGMFQFDRYWPPFHYPDAVVGNGSVDVQVTGQVDVPATGPSAVVLNVTVVDPKAGGFLTVWPAGEARPLASSLNFVAGGTVPNLVVAKVGADGRVSFYNGGGSALHLIVDIAGWYGPA